MINLTNRKLLITFFLLVSQFSWSPLLASDYVDDINLDANNELGHQVIYELNVGSFTAEGTFTAAQAKLGNLKALGVDIVWLMPIYPRGGRFPADKSYLWHHQRPQGFRGCCPHAEYAGMARLGA